MCKEQGCDRPIRARGWCSLHYYRWKRNGSLVPKRPPFNRPIEERLLERVSKDENGCWFWTGALQKGYGRIRLGRRLEWAHRVAYRVWRGPIDAESIDHLCRHRACINPDHLEQVSKAANTMRGESFGPVNAAKTHCKRGHEFTPDNTFRWRNSRICRACRHDAARARQHA